MTSRDISGLWIEDERPGLQEAHLFFRFGQDAQCQTYGHFDAILPAPAGAREIFYLSAAAQRDCHPAGGPACREATRRPAAAPASNREASAS